MKFDTLLKAVNKMCKAAYASADRVNNISYSSILPFSISAQLNFNKLYLYFGKKLLWSMT